MTDMENKNPIKAVTHIANQTEAKLDSIKNKIDEVLEPRRQSLFRRFPILFTLLIAFGATMVIYGFENLVTQVPFLVENPAFILLIGILILFLSGKSFEKIN